MKRRRISGWACTWAAAFLLAASSLAQANVADTLRARHQALGPQLADNVFKRPLVIESSQSSTTLVGDIYAVLDQPFRVAGPALQEIGHWCDILILHLNVKSCGATGADGTRKLSVGLGRKSDDLDGDVYPVEFDYRVAATRDDYLGIILDARQGPVGTRDYRIRVQVVALDERRSFFHLSYAYSYGLMARMASQGYLATVGRDKVGFSVVERAADGTPTYIKGMRGVIERNTMRYYLAVEAYLGALAVPPAQREEKRLRDWYDGADRYPRQLYEMDRDDYLDMKRRQIRALRSAAG